MEKSSTEVANELIEKAQTVHLTVEKIKASAHSSDMLVSSLRTLNDSIITSSQSSQALSEKVFWLNIILTVATVALAIFAGVEVYLSFF